VAAATRSGAPHTPAAKVKTDSRASCPRTDDELPLSDPQLASFAFDPQFNESPDGFGARRKVDLSTTPVI